MGLVKNNTERAWNRTRRQSSRNVTSIKKITLRIVISLPYISRGSHPIPIAISYLHCRVEHSNSQHHSLLFASITVLPLLFSFFPYPSHTHASYRYNSPRSEVDLWYLRVYLYPPFQSTINQNCHKFIPFSSLPPLFPLLRMPLSLLPTEQTITSHQSHSDCFSPLFLPHTNNNILVCTVLPESLYT